MANVKNVRINYFVTITPSSFVYNNLDLYSLQNEIAIKTSTQHFVLLPNCKQNHQTNPIFHLMFTAGSYDKNRKIYGLFRNCGITDKSHIVMENIKIETVRKI